MGALPGAHHVHGGGEGTAVRSPLVFHFSSNSSHARSAFETFNWLTITTRFADRAGKVFLGALIEEAPKRTGAMAKSIRYMRNTRPKSVVMTWFSRSPYVNYVIHGTVGGQDIYPVDANALHWCDASGGDVFAMHVIRGATPKNNFPGRVAERLTPALVMSYKHVLGEEFK